MTIIVFDTETSGLTLHPDAPIHKQPSMLEFGACLLNSKTGAVEEEINILVNPGFPIPEEIVKITGITDADVADAPRFVDVLPQLRRVFGAARCMVAHNLPFDRAILRGELARLAGLAGETQQEFPWPAQGVCTVGLYKDVWGRNPRLIELYEHVMGRPLAQTHRALDDVRALVEIIHQEELWKLMT